ncbi:hypothetical protein [Rhizobium sp. MHM7A]|uniref:hypothetical protein n=1 Tax=Rhizobium sp. MHM7A TaxID=2583233 RepID=UPI001105AC5C|nr:hypothetical protein [Rhizobium sp. MHM7A]TLX13011.1 hypothetical protein FFR93_14095 [Rhizobium sp. MHM7A]
MDFWAFIVSKEKAPHCEAIVVLVKAVGMGGRTLHGFERTEIGSLDRPPQDSGHGNAAVSAKAGT